jgi:hypothetical protein
MGQGKFEGLAGTEDPGLEICKAQSGDGGHLLIGIILCAQGQKLPVPEGQALQGIVHCGELSGKRSLLGGERRLVNRKQRGEQAAQPRRSAVGVAGISGDAKKPGLKPGGVTQPAERPAHPGKDLLADIVDGVGVAQEPEDVTSHPLLIEFNQDGHGTLVAGLRSLHDLREGAAGIVIFWMIVGIDDGKWTRF